MAISAIRKNKAKKQARGADWITVTPEMAYKYLTDAFRMMPLKGLKQRELREATIKNYTRHMQAGTWGSTGEALIFDQDGCMLNGQHRCHAIIRSNVSVEMLVVSGVGSEEIDRIDQGASRTVSDILSMHGMSNKLARVAGAAGSFEWYMRRDGTPVRAYAGGPSPEEIRHLLDSTPELMESCNVMAGYKGKNNYVLSMSGMAFLHYRMNRVNERSDAWLDGLITGKMLDGDDLRLFLRNKAHGEVARKMKSVMKVRFAWVVKAWWREMSGKGVSANPSVMFSPTSLNLKNLCRHLIIDDDLTKTSKGKNGA